MVENIRRKSDKAFFDLLLNLKQRNPGIFNCHIGVAIAFLCRSLALVFTSILHNDDGDFYIV